MLIKIVCFLIIAPLVVGAFFRSVPENPSYREWRITSETEDKQKKE